MSSKPRVVDPKTLSQRTAGGAPGMRRPAPTPTPAPSAPQDIRQTKAYKTAARRWTSTIVALPILMYTSYILYERTYGNQNQKHLVGANEKKE